MFSGEAAIGTRGIDSPGETRNYCRIAEVTLQPSVVRVEKARAALQGKRYDVLIVGLQQAASDEIILALTDSRTINLPYPPAQTTRFPQPESEIAVACQFVQGPASYDKLSSPIVQPISEPYTGGRPLLAEHFKRDACIDYGAHQ